MAAFAPLGEPTEWAQSSTGLRLAVRRWAPTQGKEPLAVVMLVHGGCGWHSGYWDVLGQALAAAGFACTAYDQAGCGYSEGIAPGYIGCLDDVAADLQKLAEEEHSRYGGKRRVFALGESAGGFMVIKHGLTRQDGPVAGYILCGPLVKIKREMVPPPCVQGVVKFLGRFLPWLRTPGVDVVSTFDLAFGDKRWAAAGKVDPVVRKVLDAPMHFRTASEMLRGMDEVNDKACQERFKAPFLMLFPEKEKRVDTGAAFDFFLTAGSADKELKVMPGAYHQLFQDVPEVTQKVIEEIITWLRARV